MFRRLENDWKKEMRETCREVSVIVTGKRSDDLYNRICAGREEDVQYIRIGKPVDRNAYNAVMNLDLLKKKGNIFGCDFCQLKCPYNENLEGKALKEFEILDYMNEEPYIYANMDNKYFKEKISKTSCGWRGKNVIRRNAIINLKKKGIDIEEFKGNSEYINEYIDKLK